MTGGSFSVRTPRDRPDRWPAAYQDLLGASVGRALAHEARHLYLSGHASDGLGSEAAQTVTGPDTAGFTAADQGDILDAIKALEAKQGTATVVETFPVSARTGTAPF